MRVACCQIRCELGDFSGNVERAQAALATALAGDPDLIVLPEAWVTGFTMDSLPDAAEVTPSALATLVEATRGWPGFLIAGTLFSWEGESLQNQLVVLNRGDVVASYKKMHLFEGLGERTAFRAGRTPTLMETALGPAGFAICYDLRFPELFRWYARRGAALFILPSQWPQPRIEHWRLLARARAVENLAFFVGVNAAASSAPDRQYGHSLVVDPWGEIIWEAGQEEMVEIVTLDAARLREAREHLPAISDMRDDLLGPR